MNHFIGDEYIRCSGKSSIEFGKVTIDSKNKEKVCEWRSALNFDDCKVEPITSLEDPKVLLFNRDIKLGEIVQSRDHLSKGEVINCSWVASVYLPETGEIIPEIHAENLKPIWQWIPQNKVFYKGWFGSIEQVDWEVKLDFLSAIYFKIFQIENGFVEPLLATSVNHKRISPYQKLRVPYTGQSKEFSRNELENDYNLDIVEKSGTCPLGIFRFGLNKKEGTQIIYAKPTKLTINWLDKIPDSNSSSKEPSRWFFEENFDDIVGDFDKEFLDKSKKHTYCIYLVKNEDCILKAGNFEDYLHQMYYKNDFGDKPNLKTVRKKSNTFKSSNSSGSSWFNFLFSKLNKNVKASASTTSNGSNDGKPKSVVVEVIRCQQVLEIQFEDGERRKILSKDVYKTSNKVEVGQFRQFVSRKPRVSLGSFHTLCESERPHFDKNLIGITKGRDLSSDMVTVQWTFFDENFQSLSQIEEKVEPKYDLMSHPRFGDIKIGSIVYKNENCSDDSFTYGVVKEIYGNGKVCIKSNLDLITLWPMEFTLVDGQSSDLLRLDLILNPSSSTAPKSKEILPLEVIKSTGTLRRFFNNIPKKFQTSKSDGKKSEIGPYDILNTRELYSGFYEQLRVTLPPNMWIERGTRMEKLHLMIIGPYGTPFEDGLFDFEIYIPPTYPAKAPSIALGKNNFIKSLQIQNGFIRGPYFEPCAGDNLWNKDRSCTLIDSIIHLYENTFVSNPSPPFELHDPILNYELEMMKEYNREFILKVLDSLADNLTSSDLHPIWKNMPYIHTVHILPSLMKRLENWIAYHEYSSAPCPYFPLTEGYLTALKERFTFFSKFMNNDNY